MDKVEELLQEKRRKEDVEERKRAEKEELEQRKKDDDERLKKDNEKLKDVLQANAKLVLNGLTKENPLVTISFTDPLFRIHLKGELKHEIHYQTSITFEKHEEKGKRWLSWKPHNKTGRRRFYY